MSEILVKLKIPLLMVLVCLISITGTVIYMENTEEPNKSEQVGQIKQNQVKDFKNGTSTGEYRGYWTFNKGPKDQDVECPVSLTFLDDKTLTLLTRDTDSFITGILKETKKKDIYIFDMYVVNFEFEIKKSGEFVYFEGCEYSKEK